MVTYPYRFPQAMLGKASNTGYLCPVFLEAAKELLCFIFLVAGRSPKIVLLCVTKVVWKNWDLRVSI